MGYSAFSAGLHIVLSCETDIFTFIYLLLFVCVYDRSVSSSVNFIIGWS
jgi:formate/nitrite transporter FocA (FNT family)